jgi:plastocyanin
MLNNRWFGVVMLGFVTVSLAGCPIIFPPPPGDGEARVTTLLSRDATKAGPVANEEIQSLVVTITEISLDRAGTGNGSGDPATTVVEVGDDFFDPATVTITEGDTVQWVATTNTFHTATSGGWPLDPTAGQAFDFDFIALGDTASVEFEEVAFNTGVGQTRLVLTYPDGGQEVVVEPAFEREPGMAVFPYICLPHFDVGMVGEIRVMPRQANGPDKVILFSGAVDVDLMQLDELSEVLSSVIVPSGNYTKIRLAISNPRLVLVDNPETVITDVHLTANGRLFISEQFEVAADEDMLLILNFRSLHLVEQGHGGFVLTPQLRADVQVTPATASATGVIGSVDLAAGTFVLQLPEGEITVIFDAATEIFLAADGATPTGVPADLLVGLEVQVQGTLSVSGDLTATTIIVVQ